LLAALALLVDLGHVQQTGDAFHDFGGSLLVGGESSFVLAESPLVLAESSFVVALHDGDDLDGLGEPFEAFVNRARFRRWVVCAHGVAISCFLVYLHWRAVRLRR